jgi:hypothetical protein
MQNDQQSVKQKPLIIHGAIANNNDIARYGKKVPVLVPFDYYNLKTKTKHIEWKDWWNYLFVDSGAFSVSQGNATIELKKYIKFIKDNEDKISNYASLDVVGDGETSLHNWKTMRKNGLFPIPVFHDGESLDILKEYTDNCSYVGLGAVAYKSNKSRMIFFDDIFSMFPDRNKVGFHGFGIMDLGMILRYPWKSTDSSTISTAARFGEIIYGKNLDRITISKKANNRKLNKNCNNGIKEDIIKNEFLKYGRNYVVASEGTTKGIIERTFFNIDTVNEHAKIPNVFNPILRVNTLF